jgi:hypothetical protein
MTEIKICSKSSDRCNWHELEPLQGNLKARTDKDMEKICMSIKKYGIISPFLVWQNEGHKYTLDGHCREAALAILEKEGLFCPPVPICFVDAKDKADAKLKLLSINSRYGVMTQQGFNDFTEGLDFDFEDFSIPEVVFDGVDVGIDIPTVDDISDKAPDVYTLSVQFKTAEERLAFAQSCGWDKATLKTGVVKYADIS